MKLVQCNVWWGGKLDKNLLHFLEAEKPDILCLQEAVKFTDKDAGPFLTIQQMQNHGGLDYHAFAPSFSFNLMNGIASFGNAILSRYPIKSESSLYTHLEPVENFDFNEHDYNVRNFIHTVLDVEGRDCNVLTHHGYHIPIIKMVTKKRCSK